MLPDVVVNNSQMARVSSTPASTKETPDQSGPLTHLKAKCDQTDQTDQVLFFPVPMFVLTEICHLVPRLARVPTVFNRLSVRPPFPCHGCQRSVLWLIFELRTGCSFQWRRFVWHCAAEKFENLLVYGRVRFRFVRMRFEQRNSAWIETESARSAAEVSFLVVLYRRVRRGGGKWEGWGKLSDMAEWATIARPTRGNTNLGLNKP